MEEQNQQSTNPNPQPQPAGFPQKPQGKKSSAVKYILILIALVALGLGGFLIFRGTQEPVDTTPTPTPFFGPIENDFETPDTEPPDKSEVEIEVLNGTGTAGEAAYLQNQLRPLGFTQITTGNADSQDYTRTVVLYSPTLHREIIDEIIEKLEELYEEVDSQSSTAINVDIQIITGPRVGAATPEPEEADDTETEATPTPTPTPEPAS